MTFPLKLSFISLCLMLGACRSGPILYHTLLPPRPDGTYQNNANEIKIEYITVPPQVDRRQIVLRKGSNGLTILETDWWGASFTDEFRSALANQLHSANSQSKTSVRIEVDRFDSVPGGYAQLEAEWRLRSKSDRGITIKEVACRTNVQEPAGSTIDDLVSAHQINVRRLALAINQANSGTVQDCVSKRNTSED